MVQNNLRKKDLWIVICLVVVVFSSVVFLSLIRKTSLSKAQFNKIAYSASNQKVLPGFTNEDLKQYNGVDPGLPIYLALDGNIYDVTKGAELYKAGGPYHYLAGKDSSFELHIIGADIVKKKYPIIGRLAN